jgi:hypothetical protein
MSVHTFLGQKFSPIKLRNREELTGFLAKHPQPLTGYTFSAFAAWEPFFHYEWVFAEPETLLVSCIANPDPNRRLVQPIGPLSPELAESLVKNAASLGYPLKIVGICDRFLETHSDFSRHFEAREDRTLSNYLYNAVALAKLRGRKYARKRNLLAQAESLYTWSCQSLTSALTPSCFAVLDSIIEEENPKVEGMLKQEIAALEFTLRHFDEFRQQGLLVSVGTRPVAFSIYEAINPSTVAVHFERALRSYKGLHQVINWETARVIAEQGYEYINREEDMGDMGLREAKMSYHPIEIVKSHELVFAKSARTRTEVRSQQPGVRRSIQDSIVQ